MDVKGDVTLGIWFRWALAGILTCLRAHGQRMSGHAPSPCARARSPLAHRLPPRRRSDHVGEFEQPTIAYAFHTAFLDRAQGGWVGRGARQAAAPCVLPGAAPAGPPHTPMHPPLHTTTARMQGPWWRARASWTYPAPPMRLCWWPRALASSCMCTWSVRAGAGDLAAAAAAPGVSVALADPPAPAARAPPSQRACGERRGGPARRGPPTPGLGGPHRSPCRLP